MACAIPTADMQNMQSSPFINTTTTTQAMQPTSNRHLLSPHDSKIQHRKFPSATIMLPPTGMSGAGLALPVFARQHSSSMDYTKTGSRSLQESPQFQPSSPINRSPLQSPLPSPRTLLMQPTLDRLGSGNGVRMGSTTATPRSNTPNYLPSQDELTLQNIRLTLNKCKQMGIMNDQQIEVFLQTYSNL